MEWQPIETAHKDGREIVAFVGPGYKGGALMLSFYLQHNGLGAWRDWDGDIWFPTHWVPLPDPPS